MNKPTQPTTQVNLTPRQYRQQQLENAVQHGVVLLNKEQGHSSQQAVTRVKQLLGAKKAGHTGTLDPMATGLLPVCLGEATKFSQHLLDADKTYRAQIFLGRRTDSGDADGVVIEQVESFTPPTLLQVQTALQRHLGQQQQTPPMHSALKFEGKPLYHYARAGVTIERAARQITIYAIELLSYTAPIIEIDVRCSKGTYIRTLAEDIGRALGLPAHLCALQRRAVGTVQIEDAYTLSELTQLWSKGNFLALQAVDYLIQNFPDCVLNERDTKWFQQGRVLTTLILPAAGLFRMYRQARDDVLKGFLGLGSYDGTLLTPYRLCLTPQSRSSLLSQTEL